jgi:hypothetical protein
MKRYLIQARNRKTVDHEPYLAIIGADNLFDLAKQILKLNWQDTVDILGVEIEPTKSD